MLLGLILLFSAIIVSIVYGALSGQKKNDSKTQNPDILINRLDQLIESVQEKSENTIRLSIRKTDKKNIEHKIPLATDAILTGIFWNEDNPLAILNDKVVGINDEIGNFKVVQIKEKSVILVNKQGKNKIVYLYANY